MLSYDFEFAPGNQRSIDLNWDVTGDTPVRAHDGPNAQFQNIGNFKVRKSQIDGQLARQAENCLPASVIELTGNSRCAGRYRLRRIGSEPCMVHSRISGFHSVSLALDKKLRKIDFFDTNLRY